jgi:TPR repeat protein
MFSHGQGGQKDEARAREMYEKSCNAGNTQGCKVAEVMAEIARLTEQMNEADKEVEETQREPGSDPSFRLY